MFDQDILKQLEKADVARAKAYAKDLEQGQSQSEQEKLMKN